MAKKKRALGQGLNALITDDLESEIKESNKEIRKIKITYKHFLKLTSA